MEKTGDSTLENPIPAELIIQTNDVRRNEHSE